MIQKLKDRYGQYREEAWQARQKAGLCDGLFGMGNDPRKATCHQNFYEAVGTWTVDFLDSAPDGEACAEAALWILQAADRNREEPDMFGYLYAAQVHVLSLIPKLEQRRAKELLDWYGRVYPPRDRMPVQDQVYRALKKAARATLW